MVAYISKLNHPWCEHAFPLTGFVCELANVIFGCSGGIMTTARPELPYPCVSQAKPRDETSRRGSNVTLRSTDINRYANYKLGCLWCE